MLTLPGDVLAATFKQFRDCGRGRRECVAYWCSSTVNPDVLTRVVHPLHTASSGGYTVDDAWVTNFFRDLHDNEEIVRVQVHTHPREAGHSWIDDAYALLPAAGFLSLVMPDFATGPVTLDGTHLVLMTRGGDWVEQNVSEIFCHA